MSVLSSRRVFRRNFEYKFIIVDFEFSLLSRSKIVLISGAMSNSWRDSVLKLEGRPLILFNDNRTREITDYEVRKTIKEIRRVFRYKPDRLYPVMAQLFDSLYTDRCTLTAAVINEYMWRDRKKPIIVLWSGNTDKKILDRLNVSGQIILNMIAYDTWQNYEFDLELINMNNEELIFSTYIGAYQKNGRQLSLTETHSMVCTQRHDITYAHDPCTDVILTKCIFNFIVRRFMFKNLINYLRNTE